MSKVKAQSKWVRIGARKLMLVAKLVRNKHPQEALDFLKLMPQKSARVVEKVIKSAMANATNNYKMDASKLKISQAFANYGKGMKRFAARARGRSSIVMKSTSHLTIWLSSEEDK
jgi:large subunit ribosomal protein L22